MSSSTVSAASTGSGGARRSDVEHLTIDAGPLRFHAASMGPRDGPLALLLHGFPECWYGWRHQMAPLTERG